jgi:hypothetical protein
VFFIIVLGYSVTFTKVLIMYHSQTDPLIILPPPSIPGIVSTVQFFHFLLHLVDLHLHIARCICEAIINIIQFSAYGVSCRDRKDIQLFLVFFLFPHTSME